MLQSVIEWFLSRAGDRRQYRRRAAAFPVRWNDCLGVGSEISPNGIVFLIPETIPTNDYELTVRLPEREVTLRATHVRGDRVEHEGRTLNRYVAEIAGISADDWDAIARYVNEDGAETTRRQMQNQPMHDKVDDAYRLLPLPLQNRLVSELVAAGRLEAPVPGRSPRIKVFYGGLTRMPGIGIAHRFNAHTRIEIDGTLMAFDTRFLVGENGEITRV